MNKYPSRRKSVNTLTNDGNKVVSKALSKIDTSEYSAVVRSNLLPRDRKMADLNDPDVILRRLKDGHMQRVKTLERTREMLMNLDVEGEVDEIESDDLDSDVDVTLDDDDDDYDVDVDVDVDVDDVEIDDDDNNSAILTTTRQKRNAELAKINASIQDGILVGTKGLTRNRRKYEQATKYLASEL